MIPIRLYAYAAAAIALFVLIGYAKHQHTRAVKAEEALHAANVANKVNLETIDLQAQALERWKALAVTPNDIKAMIHNAQQREQQYQEALAENRMFKEKDRALPDCVALLKASLSRACPSISAGLQHLASPDQGGGGSGPGGAAATARTD